MPAPYNAPSSGRRASQANPNVRVSHAERTEVTDGLSKHYADGRLDEEEFNERLDRAMKAKTRSDLDGVFDDLPEPQGSGPTAAGRSGWTTGRIISVVTGAVLMVCSLGLLGGGAAATWATTADRHGGYVDLGTQSYHTTGHALASGQVELSTAAGRWDAARSLFGTVRLRVTATPGGARLRGNRPGRGGGPLPVRGGVRDRHRVHRRPSVLSRPRRGRPCGPSRAGPDLDREDDRARYPDADMAG